MIALTRVRAQQLFLGSTIGFLLTAFLQKRHIFATPERFLTSAFTEASAIALYASDLLFLCMLASWLKSRSRIPRAAGYPLFLLGVFVLWVIVRAATAELPVLGLYHAGRILQGVVLLFMATDLARRVRGQRLLLGILVTIGVLQASLGLAQVFTGSSVGAHAIGEPVLRLDIPGVAKVDLPSQGKLLRAYGTLPHPNILGGLLVMTIGATFFLQRRLGKRWGIILAGALGVQTLGLFATFSRSALLSILTMFVIYYIIYSRKDQVTRWATPHGSERLLSKNGDQRHMSQRIPAYAGMTVQACKRLHHWPLSVFSIFLAVAIFLVLSPLQSALTSRIVPPPGDQFVLERVRTLSLAWSVFRSHPIVGVGPGQYVPTIVKYVPVGTSLEPWQYEYPHVVPLVIAVELGVIGLALILLIILSIVRKTNNSRSLWWTTIPLLPLLLLDHYLWTLQPGRIMLWGTLGVLFGLTVTEADSQKNLPQGGSP